MPSAEHAARAIASLRDDDGGRAALLVGAHGIPERPRHAGRRSTAPPCGRATSSRAPDSVRPAVEQLLERVALVPTAAHAVALVARGEGITAVTADGDVFGPGWARGGSSAGESLLELQAAVDETRDDRWTPPTARAERARFALGAARERAARGRRRASRPPSRRCTSPTPGWRPSPSGSGGLGAAVRTAAAEADRTERAITEARLALERDRAELEGLQARLAEAEAAPDRGGRGPLDRRARPPRARREPGAHRRDRAAADPAHPRGARPRAQGPRRLARGRRPQRAGRPRAAARAPRAPPPRGHRRRGRARRRRLRRRAGRRRAGPRHHAARRGRGRAARARAGRRRRCAPS